MREIDVYATIEEIAAAEKINSSYVSRALRLTLLAPEVVEMVLDGRQPAKNARAALMWPVPVGLHRQVESILPAVSMC